MNQSNTILYVFSVFLIFSAFMVIIAKSSVFSLLFLISSFICSSFLLFLLECEFLALLFIIIYVGAISVLFLFAIMMLESKYKDLFQDSFQFLGIGIIFSIFLLFFLLNSIVFYFTNHNFDFFNLYQNWYDLIDCNHDVVVYGQVLYSYYVLQLLISGLILLLVLIGIVYLINTSVNQEQNSNQSLFKKLSRNFMFFSNNKK